MSPALVLKDIGMDMRVMGAPAYYPLIEVERTGMSARPAAS